MSTCTQPTQLPPVSTPLCCRLDPPPDFLPCIFPLTSSTTMSNVERKEKTVPRKRSPGCCHVKHGSSFSHRTKIKMSEDPQNTIVGRLACPRKYDTFVF